MLNLDTHILIHALAGTLRAREDRLLRAEEWSISAIVIWEVTKLAQLGRIAVNVDTAEFALALSRIRIWPLDLAVCRALKQLDVRGEPADEIIAATSIVHKVPLLTRDRHIRQSKVVPLAA